MYVFTYFQAVPLLFLRKCRCLAYEHGCHHYQQVGRNITTTNPNIFSIFQFPTFSVIQLPLFFWLARCQFLSTVKNDHILPQVLCNIFVKILRNWYSCKHCNLYLLREASYYCHIVLQNVINYSEFCFRIAENVRTSHGMFLEWWNTTKSLSRIWQSFSCLLDEGIPKIWKKLNSHGGFLRAD